MILEIYTVHDMAVKAMLQPFFARTTGEAIRSFSEACNNAEHQFHRHAHDYVMFHIGSFDDGTGILTPREPVRVISAREVVTPEEVTPRG